MLTDRSNDALLSRTSPSRPRLVVVTAIAVLAATAVSASPASADEARRAPQAFDSTPVQPVSGAESAFQDAAANWSGGAADPVGAEGSGDWTATDLAQAGSWSQGGSSGAFSYAYDMRVPPAAGPTPYLGLSYSSSAHDGLTSGTNNQASWVGDGWSLSPGYVERSYTACAAESEKGGNQGDEPTGDRCWEGESASVTVSLDGSNTTLVRDDASGRWRSATSDWRVDLLGSVAAPGRASTERWRITTPNGTQHHFASRSSSRWTMPVFGNHSGEPCFTSGDFAGSRCQQAYRWMLDESVDVHGNKTRYTYATAEGRYALAGSPDTVLTYVREGWPVRVEYGLRDGAGPTAKVEFTVADRCLADCRESGGDAKKPKWPDTPWDLYCKAGVRCDQHSPAFFSTKRLVGVATYVAEGSGFAKVDSWALEHEFKDYGDDEQVVLWLASVRHTGHVGGTATTPPTEFGGVFFPNRVDLGEPWPTIWRPRLTSILGEAGGVTTVNYSEPDCASGAMPADNHQNARRCYPQKYTPEGLSEPVDAHFHKYVVVSVAESDATGGGETVWEFYDYTTAGGGTSALWAWNDAEFVADEDRDWNQWRGYAEVTTRVGDPADPGPQERSRSRFFRGLDGDKLPGGGKRSVSVSDGHGNTAVDHRAFAGMEWESTAFDDRTPIASTTTWYWKTRTAVRGYDGGQAEAWLTGPSRSDTRTKLSASSWRTSRSDTAYDGHGRVVSVHDHGDVAVAGDERCERTTYTDNTAAWLLTAVSSTEAVAVGCAATPSLPRDLLGSARAYYDGHTSTTATPTRGLATRAEVLDHWDDGPVYVMVGESGHDALGRLVSATDAAGATTTTAYTPAGGGPVTKTTATNALGHVATTHYQPAWGQAVRTVSPNGDAAVAGHDPLGRRTAVWQPGRDAATQSPNARFAYRLSQTEPSTVTTETMLPDEGYATSVSLYDSLLRHRQTQVRTQGGRLVSHTVYDSSGRTRFSSAPVFDNTSGPTGDLLWITRADDVARTEYAYDGAGRVSAEAFVVKGTERWRTGYRYGGHDRHWMSTTIAQAGGTSTATLSDVRGNTVELRQYHDRDASGTFDATAYAHTSAGKLSRVTDPAGNAWRFEYDLRGRTVATHDPDSGTTRTAYDTAGRVTSTVDGRGARLDYGYDALSRMTKVWEGEALKVERAYDGASRGVGRPHTATHWVDGQAWTTEFRKYTPSGQPAQVYTHLPAAAGPLAGQYWQAYTYYPDGSPLSSTAKETAGLAREKTTYFYDDLGRPTKVTSSGDDHGDGHVYVDGATYSPYGHLLQRVLGSPDGVGGSSGQAWQTWVYEQGTDRLAAFYFDKDSAGGYDASKHGVAALAYSYDDAGNILSIADAPVHTAPELAQETQCFRYDYLRRLTAAWAQAEAGQCAASPSPGGPGAYASSYAYDVTGNRTGESRWSPAGTEELAYTYPAAGAAKPHALSAVSGGGTPTSYTYDAAGNTTSVDRGGEVASYTWTSTGRLASAETSAGTTRFIDDASGNRIMRIDPNGDRTAWVAGYELRHTVSTGKVTATKYYSHAGSTVGVRTGTGHIQWKADDHNGTGQWIVDGDALTAKVRRTDPFGAERGLPATSWPDQRGFVGGVDNAATGLTTVGAREYDPGTGRFASADPISDFFDPQQINGYAYANNSPVSMTDPDGLRHKASRAGSGQGAKGPPKARGGAAGSGGNGGTARSGNRGASGSGNANGRAGNTGAAQGQCGDACREAQKDRDRQHAKDRQRRQDERKAAEQERRQAEERDRRRREQWLREQQERDRREAIEFTEWVSRDDAGLWLASDLLWAKHVMPGCELAGMLASLCHDYVGTHPPGTYGVCSGIGGSIGIAATSSWCTAYTRDDGWVRTRTESVGVGTSTGFSIFDGFLVSSASSAEELSGSSSSVTVSGEYLGGVTLTATVSDAGDWSFLSGFSVGLGGGAEGTSDSTEAHKVDSPFFWDW